MFSSISRNESFSDFSMPPLSRVSLGAGEVRLEDMLELPIVQAALQELEYGLPEGLYYHNIDHTKKVLETVYDLAVIDNLPVRDIELLVIAAAYHDWGYIHRPNDNEVLGAEKVKEAMREAGGFSDQEIEDVCRAILDTQLETNQDGIMVQKARGRLSSYLLDADLNGFGREGFLHDSLNVFNEVNETNAAHWDELPTENVLRFLQNVQRMFNNHDYLTDAARNMFRVQKRANQNQLAALIEVFKEKMGS